MKTYWEISPFGGNPYSEKVYRDNKKTIENVLNSLNLKRIVISRFNSEQEAVSFLDNTPELLAIKDKIEISKWSFL